MELDKEQEKIELFYYLRLLTGLAGIFLTFLIAMELADYLYKSSVILIVKFTDLWVYQFVFEFILLFIVALANWILVTYVIYLVVFELRAYFQSFRIKKD